MDFLKRFFSSVDKILFLWIFSIIFIIISFLLLWYKVDSKAPSVILHYNIITGVDLFGSKINLYKIPGTGLFVVLVNFFISHYIKQDREFIAFLAALLITTPMKLSQLVQEHNLTCSTPHTCPDGLAQYVGGEKLSTVITKNGVIVKILDDHANLLPLLS